MRVIEVERAMIHLEMGRQPLVSSLGVFLTSAVLVLGTAGCGGGGSSGNQAATTTGTTTTTTSNQTSAADKRVAQEAHLKLSDFPAGWVQQDNAQESNTLSKCSGIEEARASASGRGSSPTFNQGDYTQAEDAIYIFGDVSTAKRAFGQLSGEATRRCIADALGKGLASELKKDAKVGEVTSGQVSARPIADESAVGRVTLPLTASGLNIDFYVDMVFARTGRGIAILSLVDGFTPFDEALRNRLTRTVIGRLETGLANP